MKKKVSIPTLKRLPYYYNILCNALSAGDKFISSASIARKLDIDDTQVRKDIAAVGYVGKPKVGFDVADFKVHLEKYLEFDKIRNTILIGSGNLGIALSKYGGFEQYGLKLVAIFDNDPTKIGLRLSDLEIYSIKQLPEIVSEFDVKLAIITVPGPYAQQVADELILNGIKAIWNFAPVSLNVPDDVYVKTQNLAASFTTFVQLANRKGVL